MQDTVYEISCAPNVLQALRLLATVEGGAFGTLRVASGATKGWLNIVSGVVVDAYHSTAEETGAPAAERLVKIPSAALEFIHGDPMFAPEVQCRIPIEKLIETGLKSLESTIGAAMQLSGVSMKDMEKDGSDTFKDAASANIAQGSGRGPKTFEIPLFDQFDGLDTVDGIKALPASSEMASPAVESVSSPTEDVSSAPSPVPEPAPALPAPLHTPPPSPSSSGELATSVLPANEQIDTLILDSLPFEETNPELADALDDRLNKQQQALLKAYESVGDPESFNKADVSPTADPGLSENQQAVLEMYGSLADVELFNEDEVLTPRMTDGLDENQQAVLEMYGELGDEELFNESVGYQQNADELAMSEQAREALEAEARQRTAEEQQAEFAEQDSALEHVDDEELRQFAEFSEATEIAGPLSPTALQAAKVYDFDHKPHQALASPEQLAAQNKDLGIITRTDGHDGEIAVYDGPLPERPDYSRFIGPAITAVIALALFIVPAMIRSSVSNNDNGELERQQMRAAMDEDIADCVPRPQSATPPAAARVRTPPSVGNGGAPSGAAGDTTIGANNLLTAHTLASRGNGEGAAQYYEKYLTDNPDSLSARIELIRLYLQLSHKDKARWHCLRALKGNCSQAQIQVLWGLIHQAT